MPAHPLSREMHPAVRTLLSFFLVAPPLDVLPKSPLCVELFSRNRTTLHVALYGYSGSREGRPEDSVGTPHSYELAGGGCGVYLAGAVVDIHRMRLLDVLSEHACPCRYPK